jgi:hypothetical protein
MTGLFWVSVIPGALFGTAVVFLLYRRAPGTLVPGDVLDRLDSTHEPARRTTAGTIRRSRVIGGWLHTHAPAIPGITASAKTLDLLEIDPANFAFQKAILGLTGLMTPVLLAALAGAVLGQPVVFPLLLSPILAATFWVTPDLRARAAAACRRREFTRFVASYLELVAVALLGNTTADAALTSAATVSDAWTFTRIRSEYQIADATRTTKWVALERLADTVEVPALGEIARIMRLAEAHVSVRDQLRAACEKLRLTIVADDAVEAERVSNLMQAPIVLTILPVLALVLIPTVLQLISPTP